MLAYKWILFWKLFRIQRKRTKFNNEYISINISGCKMFILSRGTRKQTSSRSS